MKGLQNSRLWFVSFTALFVGAFEYIRHYPLHEFLEDIFPGWQENFFSVLFLMAGVMIISNHVFIKLKRVSESLSKIIHTSPDVIIFIEDNYSIRLINPAGEELLDFVQGTKRLFCFDILGCVDENNKKLCQTDSCPLQITRSKVDIVKRFEVHIKGKDNKLIPVEISSATLKENGENNGSLFIIRDIRDRKKKEALEKQRISEIAIAEERLRLAREIHDGLAQGLSYLNIKLRMLLDDCIKNKRPLSDPDVSEILNSINDLYYETRLAISNLNSTKLITGGLATFIEKYLEKYTCQENLTIKLNWLSKNIINNAETEMHILRIIQEALNNIRKHAKATMVSIVLEETPNSWMLAISDNGIGFDPKAIDSDIHFGINNMRERAKIIKADFNLFSDPSGTKIVLYIPNQQQEGEIDGKENQNFVS